MDAGLQPSDADFVEWLKDIKRAEPKGANIKEWREEYYKTLLEKNVNDSENPLELNNSRFKLCLECKQPNTETN